MVSSFSLIRIMRKTGQWRCERSPKAYSLDNPVQKNTLKNIPLSSIYIYIYVALTWSGASDSVYSFLWLYLCQGRYVWFQKLNGSPWNSLLDRMLGHRRTPSMFYDFHFLWHCSTSELGHKNLAQLYWIEGGCWALTKVCHSSSLVSGEGGGPF